MTPERATLIELSMRNARVEIERALGPPEQANDDADRCATLEEALTLIESEPVLQSIP